MPPGGFYYWAIELGTVCFIANNREFFFRHFRPAVDAAKALDLTIYAMLPPSEQIPLMAASADHQGIEILDGPHGRNALSWAFFPLHPIWFVGQLRRIRPGIAVAYSLRACVLLSVAQLFIRTRKFVLVVTGVGFFGFSKSLKARVARRVVFSIIRWAARSERCHIIFENSSDQATIGLRATTALRTTVLMGAGADPDEFPASDLPASPPLRLATMSRLVWSKGIDVAARAVSALVQQGHNVLLDIYGLPDMANPRPIQPNTLSDLPGVRYHGFTEDVAEVWRSHHAGIFPSRGGEGLPRALLEASACGRPSIVSCVPGCADFVRDGIEGYLVPVDSEADLQRAILKLAADRNNLLTLGRNAHQRFLTKSAANIIQGEYEKIFRSADAYPACLRAAS